MSPASEVVGRESEIDSVHGFLGAVPTGPVTTGAWRPNGVAVAGDVPIGGVAYWGDCRASGRAVATGAVPIGATGDAG